MGATSGIGTTDQAGLAAQGFTAQAIERLAALKRRYERGELADLTPADKRLRFVRWLVEHGRLDVGGPPRRPGGDGGGTGGQDQAGAGAPLGGPCLRSADGPVGAWPGPVDQGASRAHPRKE